MLLGDEVGILRPPGEQLVASLVNKKTQYSSGEHPLQ